MQQQRQKNCCIQPYLYADDRRRMKSPAHLSSKATTLHKKTRLYHSVDLIRHLEASKKQNTQKAADEKCPGCSRRFGALRLYGSVMCRASEMGTKGFLNIYCNLFSFFAMSACQTFLSFPLLYLTRRKLPGRCIIYLHRQYHLVS